MLKFRLLSVQCSKSVKLYFLSADVKWSLADLSKRGMRTVALACKSNTHSNTCHATFTKSTYFDIFYYNLKFQHVKHTQ